MSDKVRHLFTAAEAQTWLGIPAGTVRAWAKREKLWSFGLDECGRPMYDRDHLVALRDVRKRKVIAA
jgi:hypothetical protein